MSNKNYQRDNNALESSHAELSAWDLVITEGTRQIQSYESMVARLKVSIEYFERRKASGDEFPGKERLKEAGLI